MWSYALGWSSALLVLMVIAGRLSRQRRRVARLLIAAELVAGAGFFTFAFAQGGFMLAAVSALLTLNAVVALAVAARERADRRLGLCGAANDDTLETRVLSNVIDLGQRPRLGR